MPLEQVRISVPQDQPDGVMVVINPRLRGNLRSAHRSSGAGLRHTIGPKDGHRRVLGQRGTNVAYAAARRVDPPRGGPEASDWLD